MQPLSVLVFMEEPVVYVMYTAFYAGKFYRLKGYNGKKFGIRTNFFIRYDVI